MAQRVEVIPCLDMFEGRVVKGVQFEDLQDAGDAAALAERYSAEGADQVVFLDVSASSAGRRSMDQVVTAASQLVDVPVVVGGGVDSVDVAERLLSEGASCVSVSTAALARPELVNELVDAFGGDAVMVSLDVRTNPSDSELPHFEVTTHGGKRGTGWDAAKWAREVVQRGAGALMVNSIAEDGVQGGYDLDLLAYIREAVPVKIIASGGAGETQDFVDAAKVGADAVLAASVFHFGTVTITQVKEALRAAGFEVSETQ